jgi:hypothetical protein
MDPRIKKMLLDDIPDKDCVKYDPKTGETAFLFGAEYRMFGKLRTFQIWASTMERAEEALQEFKDSVQIYGQIYVKEKD